MPVTTRILESCEGEVMSEFSTQQQLCSGKCVPCEGGVPKLTTAEAVRQISELPGWRLLENPDRITKSWTVKNFVAGIEFFNKVKDLAESEGHHPDLHIVGYRNVSIDIWTHAINGLSLNDFILAAKIDQLPIDLKQ
jgi:4a-hydroxytetrahydrobiopterin dehydratase